ncbi:MAG: ATP-binding protein [Candidatus Omnitrophica bacterium]|nr:ATP-binding protein [Candidatus Omnitrophota bacterium]
MSLESCGKVIDKIPVKISYRIIELFSAGLYSSPNKAFEELVCNSYDAFADQVGVFVSPDLSAEGAYIWVCDNGESMDDIGLKDLWKVGVSSKRSAVREKKRLQIGRFGIGKLATYVLANKLTYICKKNERYLATTMDYTRVNDEHEDFTLNEREIKAIEVESLLAPMLNVAKKEMLPFVLFGKDSPKTWTFSILTGLKPKAYEIKEGRLKWVLSTALPLNPGFNLFYNGHKVESSKNTKSIRKSWIIGKDDLIANSLNFVESRESCGEFFVDFDSLPGVHGRIDLFEDSLIGETKSDSLGRSHGVFLMVRGRLVNLDDPLLGMGAFSHGAFNRTQILVYADGLDDNLTSTRESIKESKPLSELKAYIKKKFNNEVRKFHFEEVNRQEKERNISHRLSQTSLTLSKRPLLVFAEKYFKGEIINPILIEKPNMIDKDKLLTLLREELSEKESIIKSVNWAIDLLSHEPIAKLNLLSGVLRINLLHPYISNYNDMFKGTLPIEFFAIAEVLTEAHLYELGLDESKANAIMHRRDSTLRELSLSDRIGVPAVAQMLKDSLSDEIGLEEAVYRAFLALGFEVTKIGGNGKPDGKADAFLGYSSSESCDNYSITYDAKSTGKPKIKSGTTKLASIKRHQSDYKADYSVVVAVDFEGANDENSAISKETKQQKVTAIRANDLMRLLLLSAPKQIGLKKIKELFSSCYTPMDVSRWIDEVQNIDIVIGPVKELIEVIYKLQKTDTEPPEIAVVRRELNNITTEQYSKLQIQNLLNSLQVFLPGYISIEDQSVGVQGTPEKIMEAINKAINSVPNDLQQLYIDAFSATERLV